MSTPTPTTKPRELLELMPFAVGLGIEIGTATPGRVTGSLPHRPELCTAGGVLHGGTLMTLVDSLAAICAYLNLPPDGRTVTTTSSTSFLRPVRSGSVTGVAVPVHVGRSMIVVRVDVTDATGAAVVTATQLQAVLPRAPRDEP